MRKLVTEDLGLKSFKRTKAHNLNDSIRAKGLERCKALLQRFAPGSEEQILFSDEKIFTVEEVTNSQNDRILSKRSRNILRRLNTSTESRSHCLSWSGVEWSAGITNKI